MKARRKFGVLFQSSALLNGMTCGDNVALPLRQHTDLPDSTIDIMVRMKLELVGMGHAINRFPTELSGGMKKRCALARAIALDPAIVFYDEPSAGIDAVMIAVLDRLILDLSEKLGITSVVITHEIPSAFRISDEILLLWGGRVHFRGTPEDMQRSDDPVVRQFIRGDADGPISSMGQRRTISAHILGISEDELRERTRMIEQDARREVQRTARFQRAQSDVFALQDDTRAKRTAKIKKDQFPALDEPEERPTVVKSRMDVAKH